MDFKFLTTKQVWGDCPLDVIKVYGRKTPLSDLSIVLGSLVAPQDKTRAIEGDVSGEVWTSSVGQYAIVKTVYFDGEDSLCNPFLRSVGARPVLPEHETKKIDFDSFEIKRLSNGKSIKIVQYGEYPQTVVSNEISEQLEAAFESNELETTGKHYTFDVQELTSHYVPFAPKRHNEYKFLGKKYVRVAGKPFDNDSKLSNGQAVIKDKNYWLEVEPIEWMVDPSGLWVAKKALFAGVRLDSHTRYRGNFNATEMKSYLNKYFSKEIEPSINRQNANDLKYDKFEKRQQTYGISVEDEPMTVKEQIDFYVQNRMSFMLHGPSGVGKTARVCEIDPDLTSIGLVDGILPEDVVGKVRYPDGKERPFVKVDADGKVVEAEEGGIWSKPDWYVELCKKCGEQPNINHVLFIDEVTNAGPNSQSLIFHVASSKSVGVNKGKLPDNAVVVLAGNSKEESSAAHNMPEPLFRKMFGHIYLKPDIPDWLEWGSEKNIKYPEDKNRLNVHPIVASFVATYGEKVFYLVYNEEESKDWTLDPRGWVQVSDIIYNNKGVVRRELLKNKIGLELAENFMEYAKYPPLTLNEVLKGEYEASDIPEKSDAKLALTLSMRYVDDKNVKKVRQFVAQNLGKENEAIFDSVWVGKNHERALQIAQIKQMQIKRR